MGVGGDYPAASSSKHSDGSSLMGPKARWWTAKIYNGGFAGIVGVTCVFPMDLVKTRLQNQQVGPDGKGTLYKGITDCFVKTWRASGGSVFTRFYSGAAVNIVLITPEKAIKLVGNDFFRSRLAVPGEKKLPLVRGILAGGCAGFTQIIVTTPMEFLKIQGQDAGRTGGTKRSALQITLGYFRNGVVGGVFGIYRGFWATAARDVTFSAIYFPLFAELDAMGPRKSDGSGDAMFVASLLAGLGSGALSSFLVTPLDVVKTRLQLVNKGVGEVEYKGIADAFVTILRNEGWRALFKGAYCRMLVMAPLFGIAQGVYYVGVAEKAFGWEKIKHV